MTGVKQKELELKELPNCTVHVWQWFLRLNAKRTSSGMGPPNPIPYSEMQAFFYFEDIQPFDWELRLLEAFDRVAMDAYSKQIEQQQTESKSPPKSKTRK